MSFGVGIALGLIKPELEYYKAITDGTGEAIFLKGQAEAAREMSSYG